MRKRNEISFKDAQTDICQGYIVIASNDEDMMELSARTKLKDIYCRGWTKFSKTDRMIEPKLNRRCLAYR